MDWIDQLEQVLAVAAALAFLGMFVLLGGILLEDCGLVGLGGGGRNPPRNNSGGATAPRKPKPPTLAGGAAADPVGED